MKRGGAVLLLVLLGVLGTPAAASAHPLGNFTTNQYAGLRVTADGVDVDYLLDLAELPAYQAKHDEIDADGDGVETSAERDRYAAGTCATAAAANGITIGGDTVPLTARAVELSFPPGAGGLTTLRLQCQLHAAGRPGAGTSIGFRLGYLGDRIGWREVTAVGDRFTLTSSDVPAASSSARLTAYPLGAPTSDVRSAALTVRPGGPAAAPIAGEPPAGAQSRGVDRLTTWFTGVVGHPRLTWSVGFLAVLIAFVLGGAHAVAPGHGKTIMAAYLVGARGRIRHALIVATTVAATHTAGVLALGVVLATSLQLAPDALYAWLRLASGLLVALVGAQLLRRALLGARTRRAALAALDHTHPHAEAHAQVHAHAGAHIHLPTDVPADVRALTDTRVHTHPHALAEHTHPHTGPDAAHAHAVAGHHEHVHPHAGPEAHAHAEPVNSGPGHEVPAGGSHSHGGGRAHTHHLPPADEPFRVRTLLAMGFAGGLSPSPSAVVVLLGAAALGRAWYGVLLVLAYGIGLAAVLTGIGLALARWGERLRAAGSGRLAGVLTHRLPAVTAAAILAVGLGMAALAIAALWPAVD